MSRDGSAALFASDGVVLITDGDGKTPVIVNVAALADARLASDGGGFFTADQDGLIIAYDRSGKERWRLQTEGEKPKLATADNMLFVADGAGELLSVNPSGQVARRVQFAQSRPANRNPSPSR